MADDGEHDLTHPFLSERLDFPADAGFAGQLPSGDGGQHEQHRSGPGMGGLTMDVDSLAQLLHETAEHHGAFEAVAPAHDWWDWYAAYMAAREDGSGPEEASAAAGRYMAEVKNVVVSSST
jgi:hypothetical protein